SGLWDGIAFVLRKRGSRAQRRLFSLSSPTFHREIAMALQNTHFHMNHFIKLGVGIGTLAMAFVACSPTAPGGGGDGDGDGDGNGDGDIKPGDGDINPGDGDGVGDGDGGDGDGPKGITLGSHTGQCGRLPVTFRDFKGAHEGGHPDFEISHHCPAGSMGGTWMGAYEYGS